jgi:hypothetical protein
MEGACSTHREKRYAYKILVRKLQRKRFEYIGVSEKIILK